MRQSGPVKKEKKKDRVGKDGGLEVADEVHQTHDFDLD